MENSWLRTVGRTNVLTQGQGEVSHGVQFCEVGTDLFSPDCLLRLASNDHPSRNPKTHSSRSYPGLTAPKPPRFSSRVPNTNRSMQPLRRTSEKRATLRRAIVILHGFPARRTLRERDFSATSFGRHLAQTKMDTSRLSVPLDSSPVERTLFVQPR